MMRGRPWTLRCRVRFLLMMAWRIVILYVRTYVTRFQENSQMPWSLPQCS